MWRETKYKMYIYASVWKVCTRPALTLYNVRLILDFIFCMKVIFPAIFVYLFYKLYAVLKHVSAKIGGKHICSLFKIKHFLLQEDRAECLF